MPRHAPLIKYIFNDFFFMKLHFLAFLRKIVKEFLFMEMAAFLPISSKYPILYIVRFAEMKVHSYARKLNLIRKCG